MKVLYDHQTFSLQQHGGISRYFYELIRRMSNDADVSLFMGFHINDYGLEQSRSLFSRFFGIKLPLIPHTLTLRLMLNAFLLERFAARINTAIYHQTYFYNLVQGWKGNRVVTVYDMIYELYPQDYDVDDPTAKNKEIAVAQADFVICISEHTRQDLINILHVAPEKTGVVYLANSLMCEVLGSRRIASPYLLYVGKRGGYKNFHKLLTAFAHTPVLHCHFTLVCFGGGDFTPMERELMKHVDMNAQVQFVTGSDEVLANLYTYATAFIYPSEHEGFGFPPLEAMHYGCPVVVSNASSIPEVVGDAGVYFDPSSEADLAQKIQTVVSDDDLRSTLIRRGRARERLFSWERCARETLAVYKRLQ